jgi:hypothetical protein
MLIPFGTAKEVSVIDKEGIQPAISVFLEDRLPGVCVMGANVYQPCEPKTF